MSVWYSLVFHFSFVFLNGCIIRDPGKVLLASLINIFAPCIVIDEGSKFFKRSGVTSSILQICGLVLLNVLVLSYAIDPKYDVEKQILPPILHCYDGNFTNNITQFKRCNANKTMAGPTLANDSIQTYDTAMDCSTDFLHIGSKLKPPSESMKNNTYTYITICGQSPSLPYWFFRGLLLMFATYFLIFGQIVGIFVLTKFLCRILDPIVMYQMSRKCFPAKYLEPVWNDDVQILPIVESFLEKVNNCSLEKSNGKLRAISQPTLMEIAVQNDYNKILRMIVTLKLQKQHVGKFMKISSHH